MGKLFGTDGIRGIVGENLTCELATRVGEATAYVLGKKGDISVVIGRDTRISGSMLSFAVSAGMMSQGAKVIDVGIVPTPAVSYLVRKYSATIGIMISASHNPSEYNGIKLFDSNGFKLSDDLEDEIEKYLMDINVPLTNKCGTYEVGTTAVADYTDYLLTTSEEMPRDLKIIVDCAYGSASTTAPILFEKLGCNAIFINQEYNGYNINDNAGSTHLDGLINKVKETNADVGIAYDGDADRCLMVDELGNVIDGDQIMAICTFNLKNDTKLTNNTLVGTVMSNLGLIKFCEQNDVNFVVTKVGDRYVLEEMLRNNYIIGGEQSGHIIFREYSNTGDGELTSVQVLNILAKEKKTLLNLSKVMTKYPQILVNVKVNEEYKEKYADDVDVRMAIETIEKNLNNEGRVVIRSSGTEPLIRIMIEGLNQEDIIIWANRIASVIEKKYGN